MSASRSHRVRVGVVGLGRLWEGRHKAALKNLSDRFRVTVLYDEIARRAELEGRAIPCAVSRGLVAAIDRRDVDVVYLLGPQWFGLEAAKLARAAGKAVFCALPVAGYADELEPLGESLRRDGGPPFVPELARRFYPATLRLCELLATTLGPPRRIVGHARFFGYDRYAAPGPATQSVALPLAVDPGGNLIDWCCLVMGRRPRSVQSFGTVTLAGPGARDDPNAAEDYGGFVLEFGDGALAQITYERYHRDAWGEAVRFLPAPGFHVAAERGAAWLEMPDRIQWSDATGIHDERLPLEPTVGELVNIHLHRRLHGEHSLSPTTDDALDASKIVRALLRSRQEHRRIDLESA